MIEIINNYDNGIVKCNKCKNTLFYHKGDKVLKNNNYFIACPLCNNEIIVYRLYNFDNEQY